MLLFIFLVITEILTVMTLRETIRSRSRGLFFISIIIHIVFSIWLWTLLYALVTYRSFFDNPVHVRMLLGMTGTIGMVVLPRVFLISAHYTGKLIRVRRGGYIRWLTNTGLLVSFLIVAVLATSTLYGRFNLRTERADIRIKGLKKDLDGLRIVQISDLHLASFYSHRKALMRVMDRVNFLKPDLLLNTGDFVTYGWREFDSEDTILVRAKSRYGNFAIFGNHDFGTYDPYFTEADRANNILIIKNKIQSSGYRVLMDTNTVVKIGEARIGLIGVNTRGRYPDFIYDDVNKALAGLDSVDLKILLSHDPNQWESDVVGKTDIDITLAGHTHGMQIGIYSKWFRWSPAVFFYPHWNGLYTEGKQVQYVNRGMGVLGFPFRIWMPPEITLITLRKF